MKFGCDISRWQDNTSTIQKVNFSLMKSRGVEFVILKAAQGADENHITTKWFKENWPRAQDAGLRRQAYQYFLPSQPAVEQAELLLSLAPDADKLWIDLEYNSTIDGTANIPGASYVYQITAWLKRLKEQKAGIYTRYSHVLQYLPMPLPTSSRYTAWWDLSLIDLWAAHYSGDARIRLSAPIIPLPWHDWLIWQYSADKPANNAGKYYGVESASIDLDVMQ